jgi:hypothetical protein
MTNAKKILIALVGAGILCVAIFGILLLPPVSASNNSYVSVISSDTTTTPSPSPSPSPTVIPPASSATVRHALKQERIAKRAWKEWNHARWCFGQNPVAFRKHSSRRPARFESETTWLAAGKAWRVDTRLYRHRFNLLWHEMNHPHGNAWERWRPLVRWTWPANLVDTVVAIIHYESSGGEFKYNMEGSGAYGLMQLLPRPAGVTYAYEQLVYAYKHKYVAAGYSWSPWAGCRAFSY